MPPRKNSRSVFMKKQKTLITSRLMHISLKVDDYIYKDIPMSVKNADMFIKEISSYKDKCLEDKRSLQVIDKLTRVIKGIIAEQIELQQEGDEIDDVMQNAKAKQQKENQIDDITQVDVESILASTVDEDMTQFIKDIDMEKTIDPQKNYKETAHLCDNSSNMNRHRTRSYVLNERFNQDVHLERALSELTINIDDNDDDPLSLAHLNTDECSQSILNNFNCMNDVFDGKSVKTNVLCSQDFEESLKAATIRKNTVDTANTGSNITSVITKERFKKSDNSANKSILSKVLKSTNNFKTNKKTIEKVIETEEFITKRGSNIKHTKGDTKKRNRKNSNKTLGPKNDDKIGVEIATRVTKTVKNNMISDKRNKHREPIAIKQYEPISIRKHERNGHVKTHDKDKMEEKVQIPVKQTKIVQENHIQLAAEKKHSNKSIFEESLKPIYNKEVDNDLSWVESITYVREISQDESIPAYFEDSFWDDYTLPDNWNDDDFLYT